MPPLTARQLIRLHPNATRSSLRRMVRRFTTKFQMEPSQERLHLLPKLTQTKKDPSFLAYLSLFILCLFETYLTHRHLAVIDFSLIGLDFIAHRLNVEYITITTSSFLDLSSESTSRVISVHNAFYLIEKPLPRRRVLYDDKFVVLFSIFASKTNASLLALYTGDTC